MAAVATKSAVKVAPIVQSAPTNESKSSGPARVLARTSPLPSIKRVKQLTADVHGEYMYLYVLCFNWLPF